VQCCNYGLFNAKRKGKHTRPRPIPHVGDLWKQCHDWGEIVPVYESKKECKLQDFVEICDNPFDAGKSFKGLDSKVKGT
jgi:hypothetical protein